MRFSEMRQKEVINVGNGRRLGNVSDLEIDTACGQIVALVVPGTPKILKMLKGDGGLVIPWGRVVRIGDDVILVDVDDVFVAACT